MCWRAAVTVVRIIIRSADLKYDALATRTDYEFPGHVTPQSQTGPTLGPRKDGPYPSRAKLGGEQSHPQLELGGLQRFRPRFGGKGAERIRGRMGSTAVG